MKEVIRKIPKDYDYSGTFRVIDGKFYAHLDFFNLESRLNNDTEFKKNAFLLELPYLGEDYFFIYLPKDFLKQ